MTALTPPQPTEESKEIACSNSKEKPRFSPKIFTTQPKNGKRRKNKSLERYEDSIAETYLFSIEQKLGLSGLFEVRWLRFALIVQRLCGKRLMLKLG